MRRMSDPLRAGAPRMIAVAGAPVVDRGGRRGTRRDPIRKPRCDRGM